MHEKHFPAFYKKHVKKIYRFLYYRAGGNKELAEDLTQDVFMKALKAFDRYDEAVSESAWIYTIARNHLINEMAKRKSTTDLSEIENLIMEDESWITRTERQDDERRLLEAMKQLRDDERELLHRKHLEGWTYEELAEEFQSTSGALRIKSSRCMKKLKQILDTNV